MRRCVEQSHTGKTLDSISWFTKTLTQILWFDITFELDLDDRSIILIKTIFEETFKNARKASSEFERGIIAHKFNKEVRKIIGEKNYDKLLNKREGRMPEKYNFGKTRYIKHE